MLTAWKAVYRGHVIEVENRPFSERLLIDGKEVDRRSGGIRIRSHLQGAIAEGGATIPVEVSIAAVLRGGRCRVSIARTEILDQTRLPEGLAPVAVIVLLVTLSLGYLAGRFLLTPSARADLQRGFQDGAAGATPRR